MLKSYTPFKHDWTRLCYNTVHAEDFLETLFSPAASPSPLWPSSEWFSVCTSETTQNKPDKPQQHYDTPGEACRDVRYLRADPPGPLQLLQEHTQPVKETNTDAAVKLWVHHRLNIHLIITVIHHLQRVLQNLPLLLRKTTEVPVDGDKQDRYPEWCGTADIWVYSLQYI